MARGWTLITGASEGLGAEFARIAAAEGRDLILVALRADRLEALAEALRARHGIAAEVWPADLRDPAAVEALWRKVTLRRHVEILVNNAGLGAHGPFADTDFDREGDSVMVNVVALTILTKRAAVHMRRQGGGRILNVGSLAGFMPGPHMAVYHATKAYVLALGTAVAEELRGTPVTITTFCPGPTATDFARGAGIERIALFRLLRPAGAAAVAAEGWRAMLAGRRLRVHGALNRLLAVAARLAPRGLVVRLAAIFLK